VVGKSQNSASDDYAFIAAAMRRPLLTLERERELSARWHDGGDVAALHEIVSAHLRLVVATAARYRNYGLPFADLVQEGSVGLMQAGARFDPARNVRFSTYASWWIRAAIQEYVLHNWSIVRGGTSAGQKALFFKLRWLRAKLERNARGGSAAELNQRIARALKVSPKEVVTATAMLALRDQSLNQTLGEDGTDEWQDMLPDTRPNPEEVTMTHHDGAVRSRCLEAALAELSAREQHILRERMLREERVTLEAVGRNLGVTKERVRQIEHKAMAKLRQSVLRRCGEMAANDFVIAG
jgi:RNA polymerase sigma-32 factor